MTSPTLYEKTLQIFDDLNKAGELLYSPTEPECIETPDGFLFRFRHSQALTTKPLTAIHNPKTSHNPFLPPDPTFIVSRPSSKHTMILNKFCPIRPMLLIHTNEFEPQDSDLTLADIATLWDTYNELEKGLEKRIKERREDDLDEERELMATYGCGADAGASQAHKHMQIFPKDGNLWPDLRLDEISVFPNITTHPHPPYHHYITRLPPSPTTEDLYKIYLALLKPTKEHTPKNAYNFILTNDWMMLIPRTRGKLDQYGVNAAGMMGMVWIKSEEERNAWKNVGFTGFLEYCAVKNPKREGMKNGTS